MSYELLDKQAKQDRTEQFSSKQTVHMNKVKSAVQHTVQNLTALRIMLIWKL